MPTLIDELVVSLGIDGRQFATQAAKTQTDIDKVSRTAVQSGRALEDTLGRTQAATDRRLKQTVEVGRQSAQQFNKFRVELVGLFAALATGFGLEKFIRGVSSAEAGTGRLAKNLGMSVQDLSLWQNAAKLVGGTGEEIGATFQSLTDEFNKYTVTGQSSVIPWFGQLGIAITDAEHHLLGMPQIIENTRKALAARSETRSMKNTWLTSMGFDESTRNLILMNAQEFATTMKKAQDMGVMTQADVDAGTKFDQTMTEIGGAIEKLKRELTTDFSGDIMAIVGGIRQWMAANNDWLKSTIHDDVKTLVDGVKVLWPEILKVVDALGGWKTATEVVLGLWVASKFAPMIGVVSSLLRLLVAVPGSGVSAATLAALGVAAVPLALSGDTRGNGEMDLDDGSNPAYPGLSADEKARRIEAYNTAHPGGKIETFGGMLDHLWNSTKNFFSGGATDERKVTVRDRLSKDLGISPEAASGIVSNLNAESGIAGINEKNPVVPGSRGGFGWAQWTGDRRVGFETYARLHGQDPASDDANYGFLIHELTNKPQYAGILAQLKRGGISAREAAEIVARGYIVPPEYSIPGHVAGADKISRLRSLDDPLETGKGVPHAAFDPSLLRGGSSPNARVASAVNDNSRSATSSSSIDIGTVNINTKSDDPASHARSFIDQTRRLATVAQANSGLA